MIDQAYQGNGFGQEAILKCIEFIKTEPFGNSHKVCLTCHQSNTCALHIYKKLGFLPTGKYDDEEIELALFL